MLLLIGFYREGQGVTETGLFAWLAWIQLEVRIANCKKRRLGQANLLAPKDRRTLKSCPRSPGLLGSYNGLTRLGVNMVVFELAASTDPDLPLRVLPLSPVKTRPEVDPTKVRDRKALLVHWVKNHHASCRGIARWVTGLTCVRHPAVEE